MTAHVPAPDYHVIDTRFRAYRALIVGLLLLAIGFNAALFWRYSQPARPVAVAAVVAVEDVRATGATRICQGDALIYEYTLRAFAPVVVDKSTSTLRTGPDVAYYGGVVVREVFPEAMTIVHREEWIAPDTAKPGNYVRLVAVTVPSRVMQPAFGALVFEVEDCNR